MTSNRWLILLLALSMAANFALVGFLAGQATGGKRPAPMDPMFGMRPMVRELSAQRRQALAPQLDAHFSQVRPNMRRMRQVQRTLNEAITAEPFDASAVASALDGFHRQMCTSMTASRESLLALIEAMSVEERAGLASQRLRPRGPHRPPGSPPGPPPGGAAR